MLNTEKKKGPVDLFNILLSTSHPKKHFEQIVSSRSLVELGRNFNEPIKFALI